ncbi:MAG: ion transporter [Bacteroidetes bacterium]|nr:MAG: ion transporter [Bacteroidota bacterium]
MFRNFINRIWHRYFDESNPEVDARKHRIHEVIFESHTPQGKLFDVVLFLVIIASVLVVMLESIRDLREHYGSFFYFLEWAFTLFFTIEYALRVYCLKKPKVYVFSFFGIIDLLAILPTYISWLLPGAQSLLVIRILRLLRIFRVFRLRQYFSEGKYMVQAMKASQRKIAVFMFFIVLMVTVFGSLMYLIEGGIPDSGFTSIPRSIYWAIVTLTTVGYGDITPVTAFGQFISAIVMILGYAVIAVPTGIVSAEMMRTQPPVDITNFACPSCGREGHAPDAVYCKYCGAHLRENELPDEGVL